MDIQSNYLIGRPAIAQFLGCSIHMLPFKVPALKAAGIYKIVLKGRPPHRQWRAVADKTLLSLYQSSPELRDFIQSKLLHPDKQGSIHPQGVRSTPRKCITKRKRSVVQKVEDRVSNQAPDTAIGLSKTE